MTADVSPLDAGPRAREAAAHAVASGPDIAESQTARGMVSYWLDWDWSAAEVAYRKAVALDPNYALAHRMLGVLLAVEGIDSQQHRGGTGLLRLANRARQEWGKAEIDRALDWYDIDHGARRLRGDVPSDTGRDNR